MELCGGWSREDAWALLFLDQTEAEEPKKNCGDRFTPRPPPALYLSVWMTGSIPLSATDLVGWKFVSPNEKL